MGGAIFDVTDRDRAHDVVLALADADERITAGAVVGSMALGSGGRWSDLDLTFAVVDDVSIEEVLDDLTRSLERDLDAVVLFDVRSGPSLYRVFLLPGCLQVDLSVTPAARFGARGPGFRLLFGSEGSPPPTPPPRAEDLLGQAVHHLLRARFCIERGRLWHAEHWLHATRDLVLALACLRRDLPVHHGRGFDDLPAAVHDHARSTLVGSLDPDDLRGVLVRLLDLLASEAGAASDLFARVEPRLGILTRPWDGGATRQRSSNDEDAEEADRG